MVKYTNEDFGDTLDLEYLDSADKLRYSAIINISNNMMNIANELAEANRLKRIELQHISRIQLRDGDYPILTGAPKDELEDKA